ncbi:MAG: glycosyltransferase [Verrucomicrobiales bacterium]
MDYPFTLRQDRAWLNFKLKKMAYRKSRLTLVVASRWMKTLVEHSPLLGHFPIHHIPFGLDLNVFAPGDKARAKAEFGLSADRVVIGLRALEGPYKGYEYSLAALKDMPDTLPIQILTCQTPGLFESLRGKFPVVDLGELHGDDAMAKFFNASDLHLMPSMAESFGMMAMEAAACGVPSVVFSGTPLEEVCFAPEGGIAVSRGNTRELTDALIQLTYNSARRKEMGQRARVLATGHYRFEDYARSMLALYEELLLSKGDRSHSN